VGYSEGEAWKMDCSTNEWLISNILKVWFHDDGIRKTCENPVMSMPDHIKQVTATKSGHINC
jgi:hypothetical protein